MARIRTIKPEFWKHEDLSLLPEATHLLAAALLNHSDDEGYFKANIDLIRAECSPIRDPSVKIQTSLTLLSEIGYLRVGTGTDGKRYGVIVKFLDHQVVNRPRASKIKPLMRTWDDSLNGHGSFTDRSSPEWKGMEQGTGNGMEKEPSPEPDFSTERDSP